ncbi:isatin hydrolase [Ixodes scapularis]|uniref:isatin hydrolase n=1 Tax=Ixodes scapularis TaxID=6945 RepID=UPI001C3900A9|nr:isatin hydrolase [Ixodes scapularis]
MDVPQNNTLCLDDEQSQLTHLGSVSFEILGLLQQRRVLAASVGGRSLLVHFCSPTGEKAALGMGFDGVHFCLLASLALPWLSESQESPTGCTPNSLSWGGREMVDLSYEFTNETIYWADDGAFYLNSTIFSEAENSWFVADVIRAPTHGGTHLDAPIHFHKGGWAVSEIPLQRLLFRPIALVDVRDKTALNSTYSLSVEDIRSWEEQHGRLPEGCLLFARTGWSKLWPNRTAYMGIDSNGTRHFPSFSNDLAKFLVKERDVYGVGLDAASVDFYGQTQTHRILGAKNIYNLENLADLQRLPEKGAHAIVLPMKIGGASGAPVRVVAILP